MTKNTHFENEINSLLSNLHFYRFEIDKLDFLVKTLIATQVDLPLYKNPKIKVSKNRLKKIAHICWRYPKYRGLSEYIISQVEFNCFICGNKKGEDSVYCAFHKKNPVIPGCEEKYCSGIVLSLIYPFCIYHYNNCSVCSQKIPLKKIRCQKHLFRCLECKGIIKKGDFCYLHFYECRKSACKTRVSSYSGKICSKHRNVCLIKGCTETRSYKIPYASCNQHAEKCRKCKIEPVILKDWTCHNCLNGIPGAHLFDGLFKSVSQTKDITK